MSPLHHSTDFIKKGSKIPDILFLHILLIHLFLHIFLYDNLVIVEINLKTLPKMYSWLMLDFEFHIFHVHQHFRLNELLNFQRRKLVLHRLLQPHIYLPHYMSLPTHLQAYYLHKLINHINLFIHLLIKNLYQIIFYDLNSLIHLLL